MNKFKMMILILMSVGGLTMVAFANPNSKEVIVNDTVMPIISGIKEGAVYNKTVKIKITDKYLKEVFINGVKQPEIIQNQEGLKEVVIEVSKVGVYNIKASDDSNNHAKIKFYMSKVVDNKTYKRPLTSPKITYPFFLPNNEGKSHYGIDFRAAVGTKVYPVANGVVTAVLGANDRKSCGGLKLTIIYKINGVYYTSVYAHLSKLLVKTGDVVGIDQVVAYTGNSGFCSTAPHFHFAMTTKARYASEERYGVPKEQTYTSEESFNKYIINQTKMFKYGAKGSAVKSRNIK